MDNGLLRGRPVICLKGATLLALLLINFFGSSIAFGVMTCWGLEFALLGAMIGGTAATLLAGGWRDLG